MKENTYAPIALFAYNRPLHLQRTVEALKKNPESGQSDLIIYSDGPKNENDAISVAAVRKYISTIKGFKSIRTVGREANIGLAKSVIAGVTEIIQQYGKIIVVEDDLVTSPYFLKFMNDGLTVYEKNEQVVSIHGYVYPAKAEMPQTFFMRGADCWGWATWKRGWDLFEPDENKLLQHVELHHLVKLLDYNGSFSYTNMLRKQALGKIDSWGVRWHVATFIHDKLSLFPGKSLVQNIGNDSSGTHLGTFHEMDVELYNRPIEITDVPLEESEFVRKEFERYFWSIKRNFILQSLGKLKKTLRLLLNR